MSAIEQFAGREFEDPSMAEKSYTEMQQRSTKAEQELAEMKKRVEQAENPLLQKLVEVTAAQVELLGVSHLFVRHYETPGAEQLEQKAKDDGLINPIKEHAYWGLLADESFLALTGYKPVKRNGKPIIVEQMQLYKIPRSKKEIAERTAAAKAAKRKK